MEIRTGPEHRRHHEFGVSITSFEPFQNDATVRKSKKQAIMGFELVEHVLGLQEGRKGGIGGAKGYPPIQDQLLYILQLVLVHIVQEH